MSITVASLHIHPIKSLGGFAVQEARITDRGFEHDRRWMLTDADGRFITQREAPTMACLHCSPIPYGFRITDVRDGEHIDLPFGLNNGATSRCRVFDDGVDVLHAPTRISAWFVKKLGTTCSLVFMPDSSHRQVDPRYATGINSLSDGFPFLILSQASLDDLNGRMAHALPMDRFRPNIVITGGCAFQEDGWKEVSIGGARFSVVKPCGRCAITTTDQRTGARGKEPLRTLATYRRRHQDPTVVDFGMNAMCMRGDAVRIGDLVSPLTDQNAGA